MARRANSDLVLRAQVDNQASPKLEEIGDDTEKLGNKFTELNSQTELLEKGFNAALGAVGFIANAFAGWTSDAIEAEKAERDLATALGLYGEASADVLPHSKALADQIQHATGISGDAIVQMRAQLATLGVLPRNLDAATFAALGWARATGKDMVAAGRDVAAVLEGKLPGALKKLAPDVHTTREALEFMTRGFKLVEADAESLEGRLRILNESVGDVGEALGTAVTQSGAASSIVEALSRAVDDLRTIFETPEFQAAIDRVFRAMAAGAGAAINAFLGMDRALRDLWIGISDAQQNFAMEAMRATRSLGLGDLSEEWKEVAKQAYLYKKSLEPGEVEKKMQAWLQGVADKASAIGAGAPAIGAGAPMAKAKDGLDGLVKDALDKAKQQAGKADLTAKGDAEDELEKRLEKPFKKFGPGETTDIIKAEQAEADRHVKAVEKAAEDLKRAREKAADDAVRARALDFAREGRERLAKSDETFLPDVEAFEAKREEMERAEKQTLREMEAATQYFAGFAANALVDGFKNGFDNIGEMFEQLLADMAKRVIANGILFVLQLLFRPAGAAAPIFSVGKLFGFAEGGLVEGPPGIDRVPAMLTAGEYVLPVETVEAIKRGALPLTAAPSSPTEDRLAAAAPLLGQPGLERMVETILRTERFEREIAGSREPDATRRLVEDRQAGRAGLERMVETLLRTERFERELVATSDRMPATLTRWLVEDREGQAGVERLVESVLRTERTERTERLPVAEAPLRGYAGGGLVEGPSDPATETVTRRLIEERQSQAGVERLVESVLRTERLAGTEATLRGYAGGGLVEGPSGTDRVFAMLTRGEYVLDVDTVEAIRNDRPPPKRRGKVPAYASGGPVGEGARPAPPTPGATPQAAPITVHLHMSTMVPPNSAEFTRMIRDGLVPTLNDLKRRGLL